MTFEIVKGDLFDPAFEFDSLAQGVNTYGVMGAGIAVPFRKRWPEMYEEYRKHCIENRAILPGLVHIWHDPADSVMTIYNLFSQIAPGKDGNYDLLSRATWLMRQDAEKSGWQNLRVGLPWIGCGIAGLEKHNVEYIFRHYLTASKVEFILVEQ